jgi:hypothetical protein
MPLCVDEPPIFPKILEPAAAWYFLFYPWFIGALCERKNEPQKGEEVPLRMIRI